MACLEAHVVSSSAPSVQRSRALRADALFANSTMPFPVGRPRSSVTTIARSTGPNWENAWRWKAVHGLCVQKWTQRVWWSNISLSCTPQWRGVPGTGPAHLFQQLIGNNGQQVPHCEGSAVCGEADPDRTIVQDCPVQLSFSNLCQRPSFLESN